MLTTDCLLKNVEFIVLLHIRRFPEKNGSKNDLLWRNVKDES